MRNLRERIAAILILILALALLFFLYTMEILFGNVPNSFYWGLAIGVLPGIATCIHMYDTWDPKNLRPISKNTSTLDPKWIGLVVAAGLIFQRMTKQLLPEIVRELIFGFLISWMFAVVGYMIIQAWRYR